jgi:hypothetical protein
MTAPRTGRLFAASLALMAMTAACGLKSEATDSLKSTGGVAGTTGTATGTTGTTATGDTSAVAGTTTAGSSGGAVAGVPAGTTGGTSSTGTTTTAGTTSSGGSGGTSSKPATGASCGTPTGGTTTGISSSTINIGLHAPLTGTGTPFPNSSFQKGAGVFWQQPGHTVCGRKVQVEFKDDTYTPAGARSVCSDMAKRDFIVVGGGGTDQIQACATVTSV